MYTLDKDFLSSIESYISYITLHIESIHKREKLLFCHVKDLSNILKKLGAPLEKYEKWCLIEKSNRRVF